MWSLSLLQFSEKNNNPQFIDWSDLLRLQKSINLNTFVDILGVTNVIRSVFKI